MGVAWSGSEAEFQSFVDRHGLTFPQLSDDAGVVYDRFEIPVQPALAVVAPDGTVAVRFGAADEALVDRMISEALA